MPNLNIDGASLEYIEQGTGAPVVLVHGSVNDLRTWVQQIEPFAAHYRTVAYTRRHHHGSEDARGSRPLSVGAASDDLVGVIEALGLAPAHVVGSSYGAFTALMAAVKRPELTRTLVLGEPPVGYLLTNDPGAKPVWDRFRATAYDPARERARAGEGAVALRTFIDGVIGPGAFDMIPPPGQAMMLANASTLASEEAPEDAFGEQEAAAVTMPVLLATGEHSPAMFGQITDRLQRLLPHAERVQIPAASHGMHAQNAPAYNAVVLEFLSRHA